MKHLKLIITGIILSTIAFVGCNQDEVTLENKGRLNVHITDAPFPIDLVSSTVVTIDAVEIKKKAEAEMDDDESSFILLTDELMEIDLLELTNGVTELIATTDLEAGIYDEIRLHVVDATVILKNGSEYNLKIPSGSSSGLKVKIRPSITINEGETSDVLLDFDLSKSFVVKGNLNGNINGFIFKPVVRGVYMGAAGRIEGNVADTLGNPIENAWVKLWNPELEDDGESEIDDDSLVISTFTDAQGNFKLIGLLPGTYTITTEAAGFKGGMIENVSVTAGSVTTAAFELEEENEES
jgi:hypothetical protein